MSEISTKFESEKKQVSKVIESPIFKRKRFLVKRKEVEDDVHQPLRPKNLYTELSKKAIPLRKGHKNKREDSVPTKGLSESDRQMMKNFDTKIPERILVLATPQKKMKMCDSVIFKSPLG